MVGRRAPTCLTSHAAASSCIAACAPHQAAGDRLRCDPWGGSAGCDRRFCSGLARERRVALATRRGPDLDGVSPVGHQSCAVLAHQNCTRRARKPRKILDGLVAIRNVLTLVRVGRHHQPAGDARSVAYGSEEGAASSRPTGTLIRAVVWRGSNMASTPASFNRSRRTPTRALTSVFDAVGAEALKIEQA